MRGTKRISFFTGFEGFFLCLVNYLIDLLLFFRKFTIGRDRSCNICCIAAIFCSQIHQNQIVANVGPVICDIMQNAAVISRTNNGWIPFIFCSVFFIYKLMYSLDLCLRHIWVHSFHHFNLPDCRYFYCLSKQFKLCFGLNFPKAIHDRVQFPGIIFGIKSVYFFLELSDQAIQIPFILLIISYIVVKIKKKYFIKIFKINIKVLKSRIGQRFFKPQLIFYSFDSQHFTCPHFHIWVALLYKNNFIVAFYCFLISCITFFKMIF